MEETTLLPHGIEQQGMIYQDRNQQIHKVLARFEGFTKEFYVSDYGKRAAILAVKEGCVLLVRQYRLIINDISYEIPGGRVDDHETQEAAALRECFEETGVRCLNPKPLINYHNSLDISNNPTFIFYSDKVDGVADSERSVLIPLERCIEMVFSHEIADSLSIIALMGYYTLIRRR